MRYDTLRKSAFSHRAIAIAAMVAVFAAVAGAGVVLAEPTAKREGERYQLNYSMNKTPAGWVEIRTRVLDTETKAVVGSPSVTVKPGENASMKFGSESGTERRDFTILVTQNLDLTGTLNMIVTHNGVEQQVTRMDYPAPGERAAGRQYTGAPLSLNLANAEIKDVLRVFAQITGMKMAIAPDVEGRVNVYIVDMPWDQALEQILDENGLTYKIEGDTIQVSKR